MPRRHSPILAVALAAVLLAGCAEEYGEVSNLLERPRDKAVSEYPAPLEPFAGIAPTGAITQAAGAPELDGPDALSTVVAAVARGAAPVQRNTAATQTAPRLPDSTGADGGSGTEPFGPTGPVTTATLDRPSVSPSWTPAPMAPMATARPSATSPAPSTPDPFEMSGIPVRFEAPSIGVDAFVEPVGLTPDRAMDTPRGWMNVGWYTEGFYPGETGNAVIAGHLDSNTGGPAVFWDLDKLRPGDDVSVTYENGDRYTFLVDGSSTYPYDADGPLVATIFGSSLTSDLNLITCDGAWQHGQATYSHRLVVFTTLVPEKTTHSGGDHVVN